MWAVMPALDFVACSSYTPSAPYVPAFGSPPRPHDKCMLSELK